MQTLKGTVTNLNRSTHVSGGGRDSSVVTTNVAVFELLGQSITLRDRSSIIINDGDEMMIAGERGKDGIFKAYAYRNITRGIHGGSSGMAAIILAIAFLISPIFLCCCAIAIPLLMRDNSGSSITALLCILPLSLIPVAGGGILLYFAIKQRQAWTAVK